MKDSFLLPLKFLLIFFIVVILLSTIYLLAIWGSSFNPEEKFSIPWVTSNITDVMQACLPFSTFFSIFLVFFTILKHPGIRLLSFLFIVICASLVLGFGTVGINRINISLAAKNHQSTATFLPQTLYKFERSTFYFEEKKNGIMKTAVLFDESRNPAFSLHSEARYMEMEKENRIVFENDKIRIEGVPSNPAFIPMFQIPVPLSSFFNDIGEMNRYLNSVYTRSVNAYFLVVVFLVLFCMSTWTFTRITKWPLFNACVTLLVFRGLFSMFSFLSSDVSKEIAGIILKKEMLEYLPVAVCAILSFLLILIDFLFIPYAKKKEPSHE